MIKLKDILNEVISEMGLNDWGVKNIIDAYKDPNKAKIIKVNVQEEHISLHENVVIPKIKSYIEHHYKNPEKLEARPNYIRCLECPFYDNCDKKTDVPLIEQIHY